MKISENIFLRSIKESQRQDFLDQWNADRCKRERIYISYDSTNKNCQAGDIDIVEFGAAKVDAKDAINLYKSRDVSEKVFQADKSYLGNHCLRVAPEEAASNKIFIGLLALIIRCRIYIALKEKELAKKPNYLTVPAAIRELEKIEPTRQLDKVYRLDHAVTKTQKVILSAFGMDWNHVKYRVENISKILKI